MCHKTFLNWDENKKVAECSDNMGTACEGQIDKPIDNC